MKTSKIAKPSSRVENNAKTAGKKPGGVTGKGFMPGRSGNPGGRPKTGIFSEAYRKLLEELEPKQCYTLAEAIARAIVRKALKGDVRAASEIADRAEGKPPQSLAINAKVNSVQDLSDDELAAAIQERLERIKRAGSGRVATANNGETARGGYEGA